MDALDAYRRAALSLKELALEEQEWILSQLDEQDRCRIELLLHDIEQPAAAKQAAPVATIEENYVDEIQEASFETLTTVLSAQPDWAVAIVAARYPKSGMVQQCVNQLPADRVERIRALLKRSIAHVKPRVRDCVLRSVAEQIKRQGPVEESSGFEATLARVAAA